MAMVFLGQARAGEVQFELREIGFVEALNGTASALSYTGEVRALAIRHQVFLRDIIRTGVDTRIQVRLADQSVFVVTQNSELRLDEFVYDPEHGAGLMKIYLKGVFRFVTGQIAKIKAENVHVKFPVGTIGIRGTRVAGRAGDHQSLVMLEPPGINEEAGHWLALRNEVNGQTSESIIKKAGYGAEVTENQAPQEAVKIDSATAEALIRDLGGKDEFINGSQLDPAAPPPPPAKKENKVKKFFKNLGKAAQTASDVASMAS